MTGRSCIAALLLAVAAAPASAGENALKRLYDLAEQRAEAEVPRDADTKAGARKRYGSYEPSDTVVAPSPVRAVMHYHRTPDGRLVVQCHIEHTGRALELDRGPRPPREEQ